MIDIDYDQRQILPLPPVSVQGVFQTPPVWNLGQCIDQGKLLQQPAAGSGLHVITDAGLYDRGIERLDNVIGSAQQQAFLFVLDAIQPGDEDNWNVARLVTIFQGMQNLIAVHLRHYDVEQHDVRLMTLGQR